MATAKKATGEKTSATVAKKAAKKLSSSQGPGPSKTLAGSALSQSRTAKGTSPEVGKVAGSVLSNDRSNKTSKSLAGSVLTQRPNRAPAKKSAPKIGSSSSGTNSGGPRKK